MNFEKLLLKNKKNIMIVLIIFLAFIFLVTPNKTRFLYKTPLGRAYLIAILIITSRYNPYLGLASAFIFIVLYGNTDTITENFQEGADGDKEEKPTILGALSTKIDSLKDNLNNKKEEKKEGFTTDKKIDLEELIKPKSSKSMPTIPSTMLIKEPMANFGGIGSDFAPAR
jgi:hypothetical protein